MARPICFKLFLHWDRRAASRACCTAGKRSAIKIAMMAITTKSSMSVKARGCRFPPSVPSSVKPVECRASVFIEVPFGKWIGDRSIGRNSQSRPYNIIIVRILDNSTGKDCDVRYNHAEKFIFRGIPLASWNITPPSCELKQSAPVTQFPARIRDADSARSRYNG